MIASQGEGFVFFASPYFQKITMNILAHIPRYKKDHNSGGESYVHDMLKGLQQFHEVRALTETESYRFDGVEVFDRSKLKTMYKWADVVISHLTYSGFANNECAKYNLPLIHIIHSTHKKATVKPWHGVIYNSYWTKKAFTWSGTVFYPPTKVEDYNTAVYGNHITLVNCNENKGGQLLIDLAKANPDLQFIGVKGSYGNQIIGDEPNIKYYENTDRIKSVLAETKILIMPSKYESFGKIGIEAMCSGIPVIASNTGGLDEALGDAGIFAKRTVKDFTSAIKYVLKDYDNISLKSYQRARELEPDFNELNKYIKNYVKSYSNSKANILR